MANMNGYVEDLQKYLASKLPDIDAHIAMEIAEYIGCRTNRLMAEVVDDIDKQWKRATQKHYTYKPKSDSIDVTAECLKRRIKYDHPCDANGGCPHYGKCTTTTNGTFVKKEEIDNAP